MANKTETILSTGILPRGLYWVVTPLVEYSAISRWMTGLPGRPLATRKTQSNTSAGKQFAIVEVKAEGGFELAGWPFERWQPVESLAPDGFSEGVWRQESPGIVEEIDDIIDRTGEFGSNVVEAIAKPFKGAILWVVGGVLVAGIGIALAKKRG